MLSMDCKKKFRWISADCLFVCSFNLPWPAENCPFCTNECIRVCVLPSLPLTLDCFNCARQKVSLGKLRQKRTCDFVILCFWQSLEHCLYIRWLNRRCSSSQQTIFESSIIHLRRTVAAYDACCCWVRKCLALKRKRKGGNDCYTHTHTYTILVTYR